MPRDFLDELAEAPVPPMPPAFDRALHDRLNRRLLAAHALDLGLRGMAYTLGQFARAVGGFLTFTATGRFEREE